MRRKLRSPLPQRFGLDAVRLRTPAPAPGSPAPWTTMRQHLVERLPRVDPARIDEMLCEERILDLAGPLGPDSPYVPESFLWLHRDLPDEVPVPFEITVVHRDAQAAGCRRAVPRRCGARSRRPVRGAVRRRVRRRRALRPRPRRHRARLRGGAGGGRVDVPGGLPARRAAVPTRRPADPRVPGAVRDHRHRPGLRSTAPSSTGGRFDQGRDRTGVEPVQARWGSTTAGGFPAPGSLSFGARGRRGHRRATTRIAVGGARGAGDVRAVPARRAARPGRHGRGLPRPRHRAEPGRGAQGASPHLSQDEEYRKRFRREAHLTSRLTDPHVVPIHRHGEVNGRLFLEMRLVDGENLATALRTAGPLDPESTVRLIEQIAGALDSAHAAGLIHRDVKPSNVLLTRPIRPGGPRFAYLGDFGIARTLSSSTGSVHTATGTTIGTLDYMAPERFLTRDIDARSDVYSLACLLHECLTGVKPFPGEDLPILMHGHLNAPPPRPSARVGVPPAFDEIVARGMAKDPAHRFSSAGDLAVAARAALTAAPAGTPHPDPQATTRVSPAPGWWNGPPTPEPGRTMVPLPSAGFEPGDSVPDRSDAAAGGRSMRVPDLLAVSAIGALVLALSLVIGAIGSSLNSVDTSSGAYWRGFPLEQVGFVILPVLAVAAALLRRALNPGPRPVTALLAAAAVSTAFLSVMLKGGGIAPVVLLSSAGLGLLLTLGTFVAQSSARRILPAVEPTHLRLVTTIDLLNAATLAFLTLYVLPWLVGTVEPFYIVAAGLVGAGAGAARWGARRDLAGLAPGLTMTAMTAALPSAWQWWDNRSGYGGRLYIQLWLACSSLTVLLGAMSLVALCVVLVRRVGASRRAVEAGP